MMALRLRKDVQKASYYVWFLGAQEAKGLRGDNILYPAIPRLVERSREQEPLKVTLQVSHKGLKIIQGSSKHFIPHGAITCSVQTEDIVACVLLLYNPATKCPLHVHAYRLDSETTAQALNDQLQILINRSENQKRFNELEARLGVPEEVQLPPPKPKADRQPPSRRYESQLRRFDSSLGSDTGTSTRESECSDENSPTGPLSPVIPTGLYDSLAAELREKLNGNGPPLLLPPRDYDTVHRSKGNLAAIELRRCQNQFIVGGVRPTSVKQLISSRGSSGIGSDLAPSPERHDGPSSSDEDWAHERSNPIIMPPKSPGKPIVRRPSKTQDDYLVKAQKPPPAVSKYRDQQPAQQPPRSSYIYPSRRGEPAQLDENRYYRSSSREESGSSNSREEEEEDVKPIVMKPAPLESRFRQVFDYEGMNVNRNKSSPSSSLEEKRRSDAARRPQNNSPHRPQNSSPHRPDDYKRYEKKVTPGKSHKPRSSSYDDDQVAFHENMTDRQKFREITEKQRYVEDVPPPRRHNGYRDEVPEPPQKYREVSQERVKSSRPRYHDDPDGESPVDRNMRYRQPDGRKSRGDDHPSVEVVDRNPYRESDSMPYRESMDKMLKSPVMRYKSLDDSNYGRDAEVIDDRWVQNNVNKPRYRQSTAAPIEKPREPSPPPTYRDEPVPRYRDDFARYPSQRWEPQMRYEPQPPSPQSTMRRVSPKDRFENAKEKFQAMERDKQREREQIKVAKKVEPPRRGSVEYQQQQQQQHAPVSRRPYPGRNEPQNWSSEEDLANMNMGPPRGGYREIANPERYPGLDRETAAIPPPQRMGNAKSLSNLVKGYRHSYAEPKSQFSRSSGRVGLAAVNPF